MSTYTEGSNRAYVAAADIPAFTAVKTDANNKLVAAAGALDKTVGVVHTKVKSGNSADVRLRSAAGTAQILCGATVAKDAYILVDAAGRATTAGSGTGGAQTAGDQIIGVALEAGAVGAVIEFMPAVLKV